MRRPRYLALADLAVDAGRQPGDVATTIKENLGLEGSL
jgi:hypothetical protein